MKKKYLVLTIITLVLAIVFSLVLIERAQTEIHCYGIEIRVLEAGTIIPVVNTPVTLIAMDHPFNGNSWTINTDGNGDSYFNTYDWPTECDEPGPPFCCPADHNAGDYKAIVRNYCVVENIMDHDGIYERRLVDVPEETCN